MSAAQFPASVSEQDLLQILPHMPISDLANILPLEGEIDLHVSPRLERALTSLIKKRPLNVVVDLAGVNFIDSSGLAVLIRALQDMQEYGGKLTLSGINDHVRPIFEMARLDQVFLIDPGDEGMLAAD